MRAPGERAGEIAYVRAAMPRYQTNVSSVRRKDGPRWSDPYYLEWAIVVGDRIRRLRRERDWSLVDLARRVTKPEGGYYSAGHFSRLERGWASAPVYAEQRLLLRVLDEAGIEPAAAIVRLTQRI